MLLFYERKLSNLLYKSSYCRFNIHLDKIERVNVYEGHDEQK